jgi:hypothetical protein
VLLVLVALVILDPLAHRDALAIRGAEAGAVAQAKDRLIRILTLLHGPSGQYLLNGLGLHH